MNFRKPLTQNDSTETSCLNFWILLKKQWRNKFLVVYL